MSGNPYFLSTLTVYFGRRTLFSCGLIGIGMGWYFYYTRSHVARTGAILHIFERLGRGRNEGLDTELRSILKEKGLRDKDPFNELVTRARVINLTREERFDEVIKMAAKILAKEVDCSEDYIIKNIFEGTKVGATPVSHGVALPHMRLHNIIEPVLLLVRSKISISVDLGKEFWGDFTPPTTPIHTIFFLISPEEDPRQHLRILAKIANRVDDDYFMKAWMKAGSEQEFKEILLREEHFLSLQLRKNSKSAQMIDKMVKDLDMPKDTLIALTHRNGKAIVPSGGTKLQEGDRLTIIGNLEGIKEFRKRYGSR